MLPLPGRHGTVTATLAAFPSTALDRWALRRIQQAAPNAAIRFTLWDGFSVTSGSAPPVATIRFHNRRALASWVWDPELNFGETYMTGAVTITGDLVGLLEEIYRTFRDGGRRRFRIGSANDITAARDNVHSHYDLGNDFYRRWLDREMVYTCAYFPDPEATLEEAQLAKMDRVCRKLRLQPGERVVEAGCGWGALALFMARRYGVSVTAFNLSVEQIAFARDRARAEGLSDRVEFVQDDYRNIRGTYDAFVSVGMLEHVGLPDYERLGTVIEQSLADHGRGLLHFIGRDRPQSVNPWIRKRIFPGGYPPTLREVFEHVLEPQNLSVLDVENLRPHYATTLKHWLRRYEDTVDTIAAMFDDAFVRAWRLYLAGSQAAFTTGCMQLFQVVFGRPSNNVLAWERVGE
jgi:cyclopropane-fatty-acyl-phospholipid synthase